MNEELLERGVTSVVTRRTVVKTGAKLAYAAPLVAVTMKMSSSSAFAVSGGGCYHSIAAGKPNGCLEACTAAPNCNGLLCDGFGGPQDETPGPCEQCNLDRNECPSDNYCKTACYVCDNANAARFVC